MKRGFVFLLLLHLLADDCQLFGQQQEPKGPTRLLRLYEDDDYINIRGRGTDEAYTNGSRVDLFYTKDHPSQFFPDRLLPKAGDSSSDVYGYGIMQVMFTPRHIEQSKFQPDDYPWSGGLFVTHTLYSYNPRAKYDLQTELVGGVIGPASLAGPTQKAFHHLIRYQQPMGWGHQFRNDLLLNVNLTSEKQLLGLGSTNATGLSLECIGGSRIAVGTMENSITGYTLLRIGKMNPYFDGYLTQYSSHQTPGTRKDHLQFYFTFKPQVTMVGTNSLLEGGLFSGKPNTSDVLPPSAGPKTTPAAVASSPKNPSYHDLDAFVYNVDYGAVLALRTFAVSFTQSWSSALMKGLYNHEVGNISLYFTW